MKDSSLVDSADGAGPKDSPRYHLSLLRGCMNATMTEGDRLVLGPAGWFQNSFIAPIPPALLSDGLISISCLDHRSIESSPSLLLVVVFIIGCLICKQTSIVARDWFS
jgi:hypothetical protein